MKGFSENHPFMQVVASIQYYTQDIEELDMKDFLLPALVSYVINDTGYPRLYVQEVVQAWWDGYSV